MYRVYILQSEKNNRYYIGQTSDLDDRLKRHNNGYIKSTKPYIPWKIVYTEVYETRSEACCRERKIKLFKGGILFKNLLKDKL